MAIVVICGSIRNIVEFTVVINKIIALRNKNIVHKILFSTWLEEQASNPDIFRWLRHIGVHCITIPFNHTMQCWTMTSRFRSAYMQCMQYRAAIDEIASMNTDDSEIIWKIRTDMIATRIDFFEKWLLKSIDNDSEIMDSIVVHHASSIEIFDIADISFFGKYRSMKHIGQLSPSTMSAALSAEIPQECIIMGAFHWNIDPIMRSVLTISHNDRQKFKKIIHQMAAGTQSCDFRISRFLARYFFYLFRDFKIGLDGDVGFENAKIEDLLVGCPEHGVRKYRDFNYMIRYGDVYTRAFRRSDNYKTDFCCEIDSEMKWYASQSQSLDQWKALPYKSHSHKQDLLSIFSQHDAVITEDYSLSNTIYSPLPVFTSCFVDLLNIPEKYQLPHEQLVVLNNSGKEDVSFVIRHLRTWFDNNHTPNEMRVFWSNVFRAMGYNISFAIDSYELISHEDRHAHSQWIQNNDIKFKWQI